MPAGFTRQLICLCVGMLTLAEVLFAKQETEPDLAPQAALAKATEPSVVVIEQWTAKKRRTVVTGFFVTAPQPQFSWVLCYLPVHEPDDSFQVAVGRTMKEGRLLAYDRGMGLGLLQLGQVERPVLSVAAASLTQDQAGTEIYLVDTSSLHGAPAVLGRFAGREPLEELEPSQLRLNVNAPNGSAGSPIFNGSNQLIGMLTTPASVAPGVFFALPAERIKRFLSDIKNYGKPLSPWVGLVFQGPLSTPRVMGLRDNSPAQRAGIEPGDIVLAMDGKKINTIQELVDAMALLPVDAPIEFRVLRGSQIKTLKLTPSLRLTDGQ